MFFIPKLEFIVLTIPIWECIIFPKGGDFMLGMEAARLKKQLSRASFADILGVQSHTVFRWERGDRNPNLDMLKKISSILEKPVDYLINPTQPPAPIPKAPRGRRRTPRETQRRETAATE
jgi:transcriptional regulator with XRE-family HTH domain